MKVNITQRLRADPDLLDLLKRMAYQINTLSEGSISANYTALTAAPTGGKWAQGDFIKNSQPTGASPVLGWLCTASGTPGTFVAVTIGGGGDVDTMADVIIDNSAKGVVLKSPDNHYWRVTIDNAGVLTTADLGLVKP